MAQLTFADLLALLGHGDGDFTSVCHRPPGGVFSSRVVASKLAPSIVPATGDCWFSVNPLTDPATWPSGQGRGTAGDVVRLAAVYADVDVKVGGVASMDAAVDLINEMAALLNCRPVAMVLSGHGCQPYWTLEDGPSGPEARALLRRWGRLVAHVAAIQGGSIDPVFDLSRVLRVPGTTNYKSAPVAVVGVGDKGRALTVAELDDALTAYGVIELPGDRDEPGQAVVSPPAGWQWAPQTCNYSAVMADGWGNDHPAARHPWLVAQATRIAAAHRYGCYDAAGYDAAVDTLVRRFRDLLSRGPEARKEVPGEIADALAWGRDLAGSKTDAAIGVELGDHPHTDPDDYESDLTWAGDHPFSPLESASPNGSSPPANNVSLIRRTRLTSAADIEPEPVVWTWQGRIPRGELTLTPGRGGIGKSTFHAWLIGKLTRGTLSGIHYGTPASCIIAATEDSWSRTVVPRLIATGADLKLVYRVDVVTETDGETVISLPRDVPSLEQNILELDAALLSVDPLLGVVDGRLDTHKDRDVRQALRPLTQLAEETQCTILGNAHFTKGTGSDPLALVMGSAGFGNVARAVLGFARDPDADEEGTCVISVVKNNLGRMDLPSLSYRIDNVNLPTRTGPSEVGRLIMTGESSRSVGEILAAANTTGLSVKAESVAAWVVNFVQSKPLGYALASEVISAGEAAGYKVDLIKKSRIRAGLRTIKAGMGTGWFWCLPGVEPADDDAEGADFSGDPSSASSAPSYNVTTLRSRTMYTESDQPCEGAEDALFTESNYSCEGAEEAKMPVPREASTFERKCRTCHNPLLLIREGRNQCEKCRLAELANGDAS